MRLRLRSIEEVRREVERIEKALAERGLEPINQEVKELVLGFRRFGVRTTLSGRGDATKYPWVDVSVLDAEKTILVVWLYNVHKLRLFPIEQAQLWIVKPYGGFLRVMPERTARRRRKEMLHDAAEFGKFLLNLQEDDELMQELVEMRRDTWLRSPEEVTQEVNELTDRLGKPIDGNIKDLVIGLRMFGIETIQSCEGHLGHGLPYPWIDIPVDQVQLVGYLIVRQNRPIKDGEKNKNRWVLLPKATFFRVQPEDKSQPLEEMQQDAVEFGRYIQELANGYRKPLELGGD